MPPVRRAGRASTRGRGEIPGPSAPWPALAEGDDDRLREFLVCLAHMGSAERVTASRHDFDRWQLWVWAATYPDEVPLVNGELEFIALRLADVE